MIAGERGASPAVRRAAGFMATAALAATSVLAMPASSASQAVLASRYTIPAVAVNGIVVSELSGMAWDDDEQRLYAVSDQGYVFHFRLTLDGDAIVACDPVYAAALTNPQRKGAPRAHFNAEGLALRNAANGNAGDTVLIVSLEGEPPGIMRFDPAGAALGELAVPSPANDAARFRKKGQGLEAVAFDPAHGVITAPESPLRAQPDGLHTLYAQGRQWSFERHSPDSRLKGIEWLPGGQLLALERSPTQTKKVLIASVRRVDLAACPTNGICPADTLAVLPPGPDNFEGMTEIGPGRLLLVSDDGGKGSQQTTLVLLVLR